MIYQDLCINVVNDFGYELNVLFVYFYPKVCGYLWNYLNSIVIELSLMDFTKKIIKQTQKIS